MILNLQDFNEFVQYHHFKMDTLETAVKMTKPGCFMASIDLKDAYYTVPIYHAPPKISKIYIQRYTLPVYVHGKWTQLCTTAFTKLPKPVYATLNNLGCLSLGYIDASYLQGDTSTECLGNVKVTASMFKKVGFTYILQSQL